MAVLSSQRWGRITGSRVAGILGLSPYMTGEDVMRECVREALWLPAEFTGNFITDFGVEHEPDAIADYEVMTGLQLSATGEQQRTFIHPEHDIFAATPDGVRWADDSETVAESAVEVKCPWRAKYSHINERPDYEAQVRLTQACSGAEWTDFVVWRSDAMPSISRVEFDPGWLPRVLPQLVEWHDEFDRIMASEELRQPYVEPLTDLRGDDDWRMAALEYLDLKLEESRVEEELAAAKQRLIDLSDGKTSKGAGVHVIFPKSGKGKGRISYKDALEALVPPEGRTEAILDRFRSSGSGGGGATIRRAVETKKERQHG